MVPRTTPALSDSASIARAQADSARLPYVAADVRFMSGMIGHHTQALVMSGWAASRATNPAVKILAERIINSQRDEIALMQRWLRDRRQAIPAADDPHHAHMPGMLSRADMASLEEARGTAFDRLFLTLMIKHHRGAAQAVTELFATDGAGQDRSVFKFASAVHVDQTTEIARMEKMLAGLPSPK